jgi:tyrosine-protein kinase Etk/Wzc
MVFFREYMDDTVKNPEQARRLLGLPLLTVIPFMEGQEAEKGMACLTTLTAPRSMGSESFRSLRTALHFSATGKERKVLLVTSSFPGEGKSTISANLGVTITQTGAKVLLIDCDLRRPSLHERFGHSKAPGLTEIIAGDVSIADVLHTTGIEGLHFISSGTIPPNPAELLGSVAMTKLLEESRQRYDQIILDAPPVLAVTDTPLLAASSDQIVVVLESSRVPSKAATRTREVLATAGRPVVGLVFNDRQNRGEGYGAYGYYGYGYSEGAGTEAVGWRQRVSRLLEGLLGRDR